MSGTTGRGAASGSVANVRKGPILLKNLNNWISKIPEKSTPLRILSEDCRERFQREATGLRAVLLPNPSPKYYGCAVREDIFDIWPK
jgi:hypothetical protein